MRGVQMFRLGLWALIALLAGGALSLYFFVDRGALTLQSQQAYGVPFQLVDQDGAPITEAAFRGKASAVFFGYTHCPDICPTTLAELALYQKELKAKGLDVNVYFVTVDPGRDTPEIVKSYVGGISPDVKAISGDPVKVAAMLKGWGVYSKKVGEGPDYVMDHTATTFLIDSAGRFSGTIAYQEDAKTAELKLERLAGL